MQYNNFNNPNNTNNTTNKNDFVAGKTKKGTSL